LKKKLILPHCIIFFVKVGILIGVFIVGILGIYFITTGESLSVTEKIIGLILSTVFAMYGMGCAISIAMKAWIRLDTDKIFVVQNSRILGFSVIQYQKEIFYSEIADISFAYVEMDSEGRSLRRLLRPLFYLLFIDDKEGIKAICMDYYTKRQTAYLLDEVVLRCKAVGRDIPIASGKDFLAECIAKIKAKDIETFKEIKQKFSSKKKTADEQDKENLNNREDGEENNS